MICTDLTEEQLADNFERVAKDFYTFIEDNGLESTEVNMSTPLDNRAQDLSLCNTPACHGGWAAIMYGVEGKSCRGFFVLGADRLAEELGFEDRSSLKLWAEKNPHYWGNEYGEWMFAEEEAFSKRYRDLLSLKDIPDWYMGVSERLRGEV